MGKMVNNNYYFNLVRKKLKCYLCNHPMKTVAMARGVTYCTDCVMKDKHSPRFRGVTICHARTEISRILFNIPEGRKNGLVTYEENEADIAQHVLFLKEKIDGFYQESAISDVPSASSLPLKPAQSTTPPSPTPASPQPSDYVPRSNGGRGLPPMDPETKRFFNNLELYFYKNIDPRVDGSIRNICRAMGATVKSFDENCRNVESETFKFIVAENTLVDERELIGIYERLDVPILEWRYLCLLVKIGELVCIQGHLIVPVEFMKLKKMKLPRNAILYDTLNLKNI